MADPELLRQAAAVTAEHRVAVSRRDRLIRAAHQAGQPVPALARAAELSKWQIRQILRGRRLRGE